MDTPATIPAPTSDFGRKDFNMKRIITIALFTLILAFSAALANPYLAIEDSGVDYENDELEEAYIGFQMLDGKLVVVIDDAEFDGSLPKIHFWVHDLVDRVDFWGEEFNADISDIAEVRWSGTNDDWAHAHYLNGFSARHIRTPLNDVIAAYESAFRPLGFAMQVEDTIVNSLKLVTFTNGDASLAGRFYGRMGDVDVTLSSN